ncbi:MAG: Rpn family recombination-promoting nuclease/putative transposase [Candidatus Promineifilaceae bacterium]
MSELRNPHDLFFRETFSHVEVAHDFIEQYLPAEVVAALDLDTLELQKDSFIDADLREHFSDLLYQVRLQDGTEANVYFLLEHKSSPDALVAFQLLRYMVRIWERALREKANSLPPIVPIVVYHGREKWQISENFTGLFEGPEALRPYWPNYRYELQDLNQLDESDIRGNLLLKATLLTLMRSFDPDLAERLVDIFSYLAGLANRKIAVEFLQVVIIYISTTAKEMTVEQVSSAIDTAFKDDGGAIMGGFVEELIEQGKRQGKQEGLQEGQQALRSAILDLLRIRFDAAPPSLTNRLGEITDLELLRQLNRQAATAESLTAFEQYLNTL